MKFKSLFTLFFVAIGVYSVNAQTIVTTTPTNKNVVLEELTGIHCGYCPDGHKKAQQLSDDNPGRVVVLNIHTGSYASPGSGEPDFRTAGGDYIGGLFSVGGYPTGAVNRTSFSGSPVMDSRSAWAGNAFTVLSESSPVNVGANANLDIGGQIATVNVEAYYTAMGPGSSNNMHVILVQDNIPGPQSGASSWNPTQILPNGDYNHMHMFRHNITPNAGDPIATIAATNLFQNTYSYTIPNDYTNVAVNINDLHVAVFVSEASSTGTIITGDYASLTFITPAGALDLATTGAAFGSSTDYCGNGSSFTPSFSAENATTNVITSIEAQYTINGGTPVTQAVTGLNLAMGNSATVTFPTVALPAGVSNLRYSINTINGTNSDYVSSNNIGLSGTVYSLTGFPTANSLVEDCETPALGMASTFEYAQTLPGALFANPYSLTHDVFGVVRYNGTTHSLGQAIQADFGAYSFPPQAVGEVIFDNINLTNRDNASMTFDYANAAETLNYGDGFLRIYASQDCGVTWDTLWTREGWTAQGNQLSTVTRAVAGPGFNFPEDPGGFYPASAAEWTNATVDLTAYNGAGKLAVKFEMGYISSSNTLYIDNINLSSTVPVQTIESLTSLAVMPNPVHNSMLVEFSLEEANDLNISIFNALGQQVQHVASENFVGVNTISVNTSKLASGVYFLNLMSAEGIKTERFVVEK